MTQKTGTVNLLTFDLEEWFHILDLPDSVRATDWESLPACAEAGLDLFLDIVSRHQTVCTFFILGWLAEKRPDLVRKLHALGHEIATHGYGHDLIYDLGPDRFRQDIRRSKNILEDLTGEEIKGFRGPGFSITMENSWAFDVIAEEGFEYDSTLYSGKHGHGGIPGLPTTPFTLITPGGLEIEEYPATLISLGGYRIAFSGGGYFRLFPGFFISHYIKRLNRQNVPVMTYLHPRDLDPDTPRLPMPLKRRFKCYVNLTRSCGKLDKLLGIHAFGSIRDWRAAREDPLPAHSLDRP